MYQFSKDNVESALDLYQQALEMDEGFSSAQAGISVGYLVQVISNFTDDPKQCIEKALIHAERAVVLDDQDPFGHLSLGRAYAFSRQPEKSERELKRAIELNPSYAHAYHGLAQCYMMSPGSDGELIVKLVNDAIRCSPSDPLLWAFENMMASVLLNVLERDEEALEWAKKSASHPNAGFWAFVGLTGCHAMLGQLDQAEAALAKALELNPKLNLDYFEKTYPEALLRMKKGLALAGASNKMTGSGPDVNDNLPPVIPGTA